MISLSESSSASRPGSFSWWGPLEDGCGISPLLSCEEDVRIWGFVGKSDEMIDSERCEDLSAELRWLRVEPRSRWLFLRNGGLNGEKGGIFCTVMGMLGLTAVVRVGMWARAVKLESDIR